jgi:MraZ protein
MLLTGTFVRSIDEKLRLAIPKRLRDALAQTGSGILFVAPGTDGSLAVYSEEALSQLARRLAATSPAGPDVRAFSRLFYAQAQQVELDDQGRFRIPAELAQWAGLAHEAVLLGVQDHLELWDRVRWEAYLAQRRDRYDQIAESAFGDSSAPVSRAPSEKPGEQQ